jgi:hypothetical protein
VKDYREIRPDFTVDKFTDGQAPTANINSFQKLVNFIPKSGRIQTRLGIGELVHTPDTSGSGWQDIEEAVPGDPVYLDPPTADFATIQAILPFNTTVACAMATNILDGSTNLYLSAGVSVSRSGGVTGTSLLKVEGTHSLIMTNDTADNSQGAGNPADIYGMRTANAFASWMPGANSSNVTAFMLTYWIYPFAANAGSNAEVHILFGNVQAGTGKQPLQLRHFDTQLQYYVTNQAGGNQSGHLGNCMVQDEWQFIAFWHDFATGFRGFYHYTKDGKVETMSASENAPSANYFYPSSSYNTINANSNWDAGLGQPMPDNSDAGHFCMDYLTMWSKPMHLNNSSNITLVRLIRDLHA